VRLKELIVARGHPNITARHKTTLEVTKERNLSRRGDCIIGVDASKSVSEISDSLKEGLRENIKVRVELTLPQYGLKEIITGYGSSGLTFTHPTDIVIRRSSFICNRTLIIKADKAAIDIDREMVKLLRDPLTELNLIVVLNQKDLNFFELHDEHAI
jgi:hypothetical protein